MRVKALHPNFVKPIPSSITKGAYDLFMPDQGMAVANMPKTVELGFAADIPEGRIALVRVNPTVAAARGLNLVGGVALFGAGDHSPWIVKLRTTSGQFSWDADAQLLQAVILELSQSRIEEALSF